MIIKLVEDHNPESLGTIVCIKGLEEYLVDITKGENSYIYLYDTNSEDVEVELNKLFAIGVKTTIKTEVVFKFYICELSETEKSCESWPLTGCCFGDFKVVFKTDGAIVAERLMNWWQRTKEPSVKLAEAIVLDHQLREELV